MANTQPCYCEMRGCPCGTGDLTSKVIFCSNDSTSQTKYGITFLGTQICEPCINYCIKTYPTYVFSAHDPNFYPFK